MADALTEINAATWRAAAAEAYNRAGAALCDATGGYQACLEWQRRAVDYARRAMVLTSKGDNS